MTYYGSILYIIIVTFVDVGITLEEQNYQKERIFTD